MTRTGNLWRMFALSALVFVAVACGDSDAASDGESTQTTAAPSVSAEEAEQPSTTEEAESPTPSDNETEPAEADDGGSGSGSGVILADLCSEGQPVNGAISLDDLVNFGLLSSPEATVEGNGAYNALAYENFGFLCNITEVGGEEENFITIGVNAGSDTWDLALEQGEAAPERMGDWDVIVGSNWLSPLTMRYTDAAGNQDTLFALWVPADGSIPDRATLDRVMRPLGEAIAAGVTMNIPRS